MSEDSYSRPRTCLRLRLGYCCGISKRECSVVIQCMCVCVCFFFFVFFGGWDGGEGGVMEDFSRKVKAFW